MMGQHNILTLCFQVMGSVFVQSTMINDDSKVVSCSKGTFSNVLESVVIKILSGDKPPDPIFLPFHLDSNYSNFLDASNDIACMQHGFQIFDWSRALIKFKFSLPH